MEGGKDLRRLERLSKSLLLDKEIPPDIMDKLRVLLQNKNLDPEYRYREIISRIQHLPDKKIISGEEIELKETRKEKPQRKDIPSKEREIKPLLGPTESALYIDSLCSKYKSVNLFKKRYLVHRSNRLGIGLRKRLVPTKYFKDILEKIADLHERVIYRLSGILDDILFDPDARDPLVYNYLKVFYSWMTTVPLLRINYDKIVWLERKDFDREFKAYLSHFFSFYKLGTSVRENIIFEIENRLRGHGSSETKSGQKRPEKIDLAMETEITRILAAIRFFLPNSLEETGTVSKEIFGTGEIKNMQGFLFAVTEALIFQRTFLIEELIEYYRIVPPQIKKDVWDCKPELLDKAGKNRQQQLKAELLSLKAKMAPYETIASLLSLKDGGELLLHKAMREYWRIIHSKDWQPKQVFDTHYMLFVYSVCAYFMDVYMPLIKGIPVYFRDYGREEMEGSIFSTSYFESETGSLYNVYRSFKSMYASKSIPRAERVSIRQALLTHGDNEDPAIRLLAEAGDAFFRIGRELQRLLDKHRLWKFNGGSVKSPDDIRTYLNRIDDGANGGKNEGPVPFYDCLLINIPGAGALGRDLFGKRIIEDSTTEGLFISAAAISLQSAQALMNDELEQDLNYRNELAVQIESLSKEIT